MSNEVLDKIQQVKLEKDTKIIPENIKLNETIFGIEGQLEGDVGLGTTLLYLENQVQVLSTAINGKAGISTDATAEASDILIGQTAYVNGQKITGIMPNNGTLNYSPSVGVQNIPSGYTTGGIISGVTSSIDPNITAANIKKGVTILNVAGTFVGSGGSNASIKVFDSISNMNADASPVNNGLAVVYDGRGGNLTSTDTFQSIIFPQSVTLPNAIPSGSSISCSFQPTDYESMVMMNVSLDDTSFMLSYDDSENGINFSVNYMCYDMDGQHYTRDNLPSSTGSIVVSGDTVDFGQEFKSSYGWNDAIGYFMSVGIQEFNGLFKYTNNSYGLAPSQLTTKKDYVYNSIFFGVDGVEEGTLQTCNNLTLNDVKIKSEIYGSISQLTLNNNITSMYNAMQYDYNLTYLPEIDTRNIVNMYGAFRGCRNLVGIPNFDTVNVTNMAYMLAECRNLKEVPQFNTVNITNIQGMFYECNNLSNASIQNIINMCLNSNITNISVMNFSNRNQYSPLYFTQYDNSYYQNRLTDLTNAGWSY